MHYISAGLCADVIKLLVFNELHGRGTQPRASGRYSTTCAWHDSCSMLPAVYCVSLPLRMSLRNAPEALKCFFFSFIIFQRVHNGLDCPAFNYNIPSSIIIMFLGVVIYIFSDFFFIHISG